MAITVLAKPSMQGDPMVQIRPRSGQKAWPFEAQRPRLRARTLLFAVFVASTWPAVVGAAGLDNGGGPGAPPSAENSTGAGSYAPPPSCTRWFDGCNDCQKVGGGRPPICTQRMCAPGTVKSGYCKSTE